MAYTWKTMTIRNPRASLGFSLSELIVGLAIAMIIFLVISVVFSNFESQKRVTTSSSDTQSSGGMAMIELEQAFRSAGAGNTADDIITTCTTANTKSYYYKSATATVTAPVPGYGQSFAPIMITSGGATGSDSIDVRVGGFVQGITPVELAADLKTTDTNMIVKRGTGFVAGQVVLAVDSGAGKCMVLEIKSVDSNDPKTLNISPNTADTWNPTPAYKNTNTWPTLAALSTVIYTPGSITYRTYSINASKQLQVVNQRADAAASTDVLVGDVVSLQAQYGVSSAAGVQNVSNWVEPTGTWAAASLTTDQIKRIKAIRFAIVMRSPKLESTNVTSTCVNNAGTNNGPCAWQDTATDPAPKIDLSADANWQKYRYRVFQTIVPIRNQIWAGV